MSEHHTDEQLLVLTTRDLARERPDSWIGTLGLLGPVRRRRPLVYSATCPCCQHRTATLRITIGGERVTCTTCPILEVRAALLALHHRTPSLAEHPAREDNETRPPAEGALLAHGQRAAGLVTTTTTEGPMPGPRKQLNVCNEPGCPELTEGRKCRAHRRPDSTARGYDHRWAQQRGRYLKHHPACEQHGCDQPAAEVHHLDGLGPKGPDGYLWTNLQALCKPHHSAITVRNPGGLHA